MEVPTPGLAPLPGPADTSEPPDALAQWYLDEEITAPRPAAQLIYAVELKKMDAGGAFQVVADYDGQREPHRGYLPVSMDDLVHVTPNSRQPGDDGNRYKEYLYGHRVKPPRDEGWLPLHILALDKCVEEA